MDMEFRQTMPVVLLESSRQGSRGNTQQAPLHQGTPAGGKDNADASAVSGRARPPSTPGSWFKEQKVT